MKTRLELLTENLTKVRAKIAALNDQVLAARGADATMLASERRQYDQLVTEEAQLVVQYNAAQEAEARNDAEAEARMRVGHGGRSATYVGGADTVYARGEGSSYFRDLMTASSPGHSGQGDASQRLFEHAQMVDRAAEDLPREWRATSERGASLEKRVNPNRTDGQGGYFVPPLWLVGEYVELLRNGRAAADRCNLQPLPAGTDNVSLPKIATGTTTAIQTADAGSVSSTDFTDTSVSGPVRTIAGQNDVSLQLLEQSPINMDEVVFNDLLADYNQKLCAQVLTGSGTSGQMTGLLTISGTNAITYTDATPTLPEMLVPMGQGLSKVATVGKVMSDTILMHPTIWYWMTTQLDTANRPLVDLGNGQNSIAVMDANAVAGVAGSMGTTPIVVDLNLPTNLGGGTNETRTIEGRFKEAWLFESAPRMRVFQEVLSGTLQVRIQLYNYTALIADRRPAAFSVLAGTGMIPPSGF
jgi:HK97 family phage major capsid protein